MIGILNPVRDALEAEMDVVLPSHVQFTDLGMDASRDLEQTARLLPVALAKHDAVHALEYLARIVWIASEVAVLQGLDLDCAWLEIVQARSEGREPNMTALVRSKP